MRFAILSILSAAMLGIAGCGSTVTNTGGTGGSGGSSEPNSCKTTNVTSPAQPAPTKNYSLSGFTGAVRAGSLPIAGASVQVYAAGTAGNGSAPTVLLNASITTDSTGAFTTGNLTCPFSNSVVYLIARGGSVSGSGASNSAIAMALVLGSCSAVESGAGVIIDEATTVASAWALAPFIGNGGQIGATATNSSGIGLGAATALNLVNPATGKTPGISFPASGTAPTAKINTLANVLNGCVVTSSSSSTACTQLFASSSANGAAPTNTLDAAMNIARSPGANVTSIYGLAGGSAPYLPSLSAPPSDWTLFATYSGGGMDGPSSLSIDSRGTVWVANYFGIASLFSNAGAPVFPQGITGNGLQNSYGGAVDVNDIAWIANEQSSNSVNSGLGSVTLLDSTGGAAAQYSSGGLNFPIAVAFDTSGVVWVVDYGNSHISLLSSNGSALSGATGYTSANLEFPSAIATDSKCNAYVANQSSNTITRVIADGSAFTDFVVGQGPASVAVDSADNVWSANFYANSVGLVSSAGTILSGTGYTGGGVNAPRAIAVDGNGNAWVASERGSTLAEFAAASSANPGQLLSPSAGWGADAKLLEPYSLAIDAAGNIWVSNYASNTLTEFIGLAAPVKTPLLGPVRVP
ncbi:MAG TPA: NHL repeat-containing protein [Bryocella sp.]|nr:NHL repeat-containing protein [Bryocella sp.]